MTKKKTPNIFILLELDPTQSWSQADLEREIQKKRQEWSRLVNLPTQKGIQAKQNLSLVSTLHEIAGDEAQRKAQAAEARKQKKEEQAGKLEELEERLQLIQAKGHILEEELQLLLKEFAGLLSEAEMRKRLTVPVEKGHPAGRARKATLDSTKAKSIESKLEGLRNHRGLDKKELQSLYDFLGIGETTESQALIKEAQRQYDGVQKKGVKTAEDTLISELSGYCLDIFKTETERSKYNETLRLQQYEELTKKIDGIGWVSKEIDEKQMEQLLREARAKGLDVVEAEAVIKEYAANKKYAVIISSQATEVIKQLQRCGYCHELNDIDKTYCTNCGQPLKESCPKCSKPVNSGDMACGQCGFPTGNRFLVKLLINDADQAYRNQEYETARAYLEQAEQAWPAPADSDHPLSKEIRVLEAKIAPQQQAQTRLLSQAESAIKQKRFYALRELLPRLEKALPTGSREIVEYRRQVETRLQMVERKLGQARRVEGNDPEKAVSICQDVLRICQDCQEARDMLAKTPPAAPKILQAEVSDRVTHLTWQPSPSQGVRYTVVRKKHSRPVSVGDGEKLAMVAGTVYEDSTTEVGIPIFYAVFADREGISSTTGATIAQPIIKLQEVAKLTARVGNRQVHLQWEPPSNVHEIVVVRSDTAYPASIQAGHHIPVLDEHQAVDNAVKNEQRYFYTIFCRFKDYTGKLQTTSGVRIEAIPQQPPRPIKELHMSANGPLHARQLELRWSPPAKGDVVIIKSGQTINLQTGEIIPRQELSNYGQILTTTANRVSEKINQLGFYYFLPVVVFQGMAYIGQEHKYICVDDVSDLSVQNLGHALRLQWQWPQNCHEVLVGFSNKSWPKPNQPDAVTIPLTRAQYDLHGYYDISNPVKADHYITVFAVISQEEQKIIASGEDKAARKLVSLASRVALSYEIKKSWFGKKFSLDLSIKGEGKLPALILTRKQTTLPMNKHDGEIILQLGAAAIEKDRLNIALPKGTHRRQSYAKLFLANDNLYERITIRHPAREKLRLF